MNPFKKNSKKLHSCNICNKTFPCKSKLVVHERCHTGEKPFECQTCEKRFAQKSHYSEHLKLHSEFPRKRECGICNFKFTYKQSLKTHKLIVHKIGTVSAKLECLFCQKICTNSTELEKHLYSHTKERPYFCQKCPEYEFSSASNLKQHTRACHTNNAKPFKCPMCEKSSSNNSNLQKHIQIHLGERPFKCENCRKDFVTKPDLKSHQMIHQANRERLFKCDQCSKTFYTKADLKKHLKIHSADKTFVCKYCQKAFLRKSNLVVHERIHTGEKPFSCKVCGISHSGNLKSHLLTHNKKVK